MKVKPCGNGYPKRYDVMWIAPDGEQDIWSFYNQDLALENLEVWQRENPTHKFELHEK